MATTSTLTEDQFLLIAKTLADPRRYAILRQILESETATPCSAMRDCVEVSPATLSHHMKELEAAGLIHVQRNGKFVSYTPAAEILKAYVHRLSSDLT